MVLRIEQLDNFLGFIDTIGQCEICCKIKFVKFKKIQKNDVKIHYGYCQKNMSIMLFLLTILYFNNNSK